MAAVLRERGLPLLLHANEPVGHHYPGKSRFGPEACVACAEPIPGLKLVFAHMGGGTFLYEAMPEFRQVLADVYYDTSAVPYLYDAGDLPGGRGTAGGPQAALRQRLPPALAGALQGGLEARCRPAARGGRLRRQRTKGLQTMSQSGANRTSRPAGRAARRALLAGDLGLEDALSEAAPAAGDAAGRVRPAGCQPGPPQRESPK